MPEGDTIFRSARTLREALQNATVTAVRTRVTQVRRRGPDRLVGQRIAEIESRGKHLLMWFQPSDLALHTHMLMTGSWHLYRPDQPWQRPARQVTLRLDTPAWVAVAFNVPVCELLSRVQIERHPTLFTLGPDALGSDTDLVHARARLDQRGGWTIAEALLDQRVLAGVGNVYKCEVLFMHGINPWTRVCDVPGDVRSALLETATELLKQNIAPGSSVRITTTTARSGSSRTSGTAARSGISASSKASDALYVYGRARRPCRRCSTPISMRRQGTQARVTYWCQTCQPALGVGPA